MLTKLYDGLKGMIDDMTMSFFQEKHTIDPEKLEKVKELCSYLEETFNTFEGQKVWSGVNNETRDLIIAIDCTNGIVLYSYDEKPEDGWRANWPWADDAEDVRDDIKDNPFFDAIKIADRFSIKKCGRNMIRITMVCSGLWGDGDCDKSKFYEDMFPDYFDKNTTRDLTTEEEAELEEDIKWIKGAFSGLSNENEKMCNTNKKAKMTHNVMKCKDVFEKILIGANMDITYETDGDVICPDSGSITIRCDSIKVASTYDFLHTVKFGRDLDCAALTDGRVEMVIGF